MSNDQPLLDRVGNKTVNDGVRAKGPLLIFTALLIGFVAYLTVSVPGMPGRVASHFDGSGTPDGWMARSTYGLTFGLFGAGGPLLIVVAFWATRFLPARLINLPQREYWLAAERRAETLHYLLRAGLWFACMLIALMGAVHYLVVRANESAAPSLSRAIWLVTGLFVTGTGVWLVTFYRHFCKRQPARDEELAAA